MNLFNLTSDIIGTTSVNLDATASALSELLKGYIDQDDAAAAQLSSYLDENYPEHRLDDDDKLTESPDQVEDLLDDGEKPYDELDDLVTTSELDSIANEEAEKE